MRLRWRSRILMWAAAVCFACGMIGYHVGAAEAADTETADNGGTSGDNSGTEERKDISGNGFRISWTEEAEYTYTGSPITPEVTVTEISAPDVDKTLTEDTDYTVTYADNTDAGTARVTIEGVGSYSGQSELTFEIGKKDINDLEMKGKDKVYRGSPINADVNMYYNGMKLERSKDYRIKDYSNNENVGTASATVKGKGNYKGKRTMTFEIAAQNIYELSYTPDLSKKSYVYTGQSMTPKVTLTFDIKGKDNVVIGQRDLVEGEDYTITYADNKKVGTAGVMIIGKGNFRGSRVMSFKIKPQGTTIEKLVKGKKKIKVKWTKKEKQVTGYVILCSTKKDFSSNVKRAKVKKNTTQYTFKKLKAKKRYYVKVRTYKQVAGTTYYSAWSEVMKIKTK